MFLASASNTAQAVLHIQWWEWLTLIVIAVTGIAVDMYANRGHQVPPFKRAVRMVLMFVAVGVLYGVFVGIMHGGDAALLYFAAFGTEYSLSIDNVFIMVVIFDTFKVPAKYRHKLLFLGVFGALVFRFIFILVGSVLLNAFRPVMTPILALLVGFAVYKVWKEDTEGEIEDSGAYKFAKKILPLKEGRNYGGKFFIRETIEVTKNGVKKKVAKIFATYLALCLVVIELMDLLFAVDSVPAALAITSITYIVYSSNAMAILGLRALYFVIGPLKDKMSWLNEGLAVILAWVTLKLLLGWEFAIGGFHWGPVWHPPIWFSPAVIAVVLAIAVVASIYWPKQEENKDVDENDRVIFNAAVVVHGGESYLNELANGQLQRVYCDTLAALNEYDTDGVVPVVVARAVPELDGTDELDAPRSLDYLLGRAHGEVNLAPAIRRALAELPEDEPALVAVISDFSIADQAALEELIDELAVSGRQVFIKLVFMTSDSDGNIELPQALDDRHTGVQDKVDAVYATGYHGESGESIRDHFGRELDNLVRLIHRTRKQDDLEPASIG